MGATAKRLVPQCYHVLPTYRWILNSSDVSSTPFEKNNRWIHFTVQRVLCQMDEYFIVQSGMFSRLLFIRQKYSFCSINAIHVSEDNNITMK